MTHKRLWAQPIGRLSLFALLQVFMVAASAPAQIIDWNNVAGGAYTTPGNWNPANVPNTMSESAQFNLAGMFEVTFSASSSTTIDHLFLEAGDVTFRNAGSFSDATLNVTGNMRLDGGDLTLERNGGTADVNINVSSQLQITGGSELSVLETAQVTADSLLVGNNTLGVGTLTIDNGNVTATDFTKASNGTLNFDGGVFEITGGDGVFNSSFLYGGAVATAPEFRATNGADVVVTFGWQIGISGRAIASKPH